MKNLIKPILIAIVIFASFSGCKKFENYDTIIEVVVPMVCEDCEFYIYNTEDEEDFERSYNGNYEYQYPDYEYTPGSVVEITIDWTERHLPIDPDISIQLFMRDPDKSKSASTYTFDITVNQNQWEDGPEYLKPGRVYIWDPVEGSFEKTGEKTDKKKDKRNTKSGSSGSVNSTDGYWIKHNKTGIIHLSGSTSKFCQVSDNSEYVGSYSSSNKTIDINLNGTQAHFEIKVSGDTLTLIQEFSSGHSSETIYYRSSSSEYPC